MKSILKNLIYCTWVTLCSLGLVELALMFFAPAPEVELLNITTGNSMQYQLVENPKLIYIPVAKTGDLNSQGHRGAEFLKAPQKQRWTFIGDSVVEGYGIKTEQRFTELLQTELPDEIINLGVRGYNLWQDLEYFKLKDIETNKLTVGIAYNDLTVHSGEINAFKTQIKKLKKGGLYNFYYSKKKDFLRKIYKLHVFRYALALCSDKSSNAFNKDGNGLFEKDKIGDVFDEFKLIANQKNIKLSFIIFPVNPNSYFDQELVIIRQILINKNLNFLDIDKISKQRFSEAERKTWFINALDPCHLSPKGMQVVKKLILELGKDTLF